MSGVESDWSEGQILRNTNHIDRMVALKIPRYDYSLLPDVLDRIIRAAFVSIGYESPTDNQRLPQYYSVCQWERRFRLPLPTGEGKSLCFATV